MAEGVRTDSQVDQRRSAWMGELDPGIAGYVEVLVMHGVETFESCQGGEGHCFPEPTIRLSGQRPAGFRALSVAQDHAMPVSALRRCWSIEDGEPTGPHWELVFWEPSTAWRTDEQMAGLRRWYAKSPQLLDTRQPSDDVAAS